jgi:hypothetical protein
LAAKASAIADHLEATLASIKKSSEVSTGIVDPSAEPLASKTSIPTERLQSYHAKCLYHVFHQGCETTSKHLEALLVADCKRGLHECMC